MNPNPRPHLFGMLAGLFLACGIAFASLTLAHTWARIAESQVVSVTGSARKNVRSDLAVWHASYSADAPTLLEAQQRLHAAQERVLEFLHRHGLSDISVQPVRIHELLARRPGDDPDDAKQRLGYQLSQELEIRSREVEKLPRLAADTGALLEQDITFISVGFEFIYTKAGETKVEMMAEATRDARARAEQIGAQGGRQLKELRSARMGVVQINPLYSAATSWEGNNDTSAIEKTITATVSATFALQ